MSLKDYSSERLEVTFKGGSFSVRGLSLDDVTALITKHLPDLDKLADLLAGKATQETAAMETMSLALKLVVEAPALVAQAIALAADEPDFAENARKLPLPVQIDAVKKIGRLTFEESGGAKKFFESLSGLVSRTQLTRTTDSLT